jgi:hypothetical protein
MIAQRKKQSNEVRANTFCYRWDYNEMDTTQDHGKQLHSQETFFTYGT